MNMSQVKSILLKLRESSIVAIKLDIKTKCSEIASVEERFRSYNIKYKEVDSEIKQLSAQNSQQKKTEKKTLEEKIQLKEQSQSLEKEKKLIENKIKRVEHAASEIEEEMKGQDGVLSKLSDEIDFITTKLKSMKSKLADSTDISKDKERYHKTIQEKNLVQGQHQRLTQLRVSGLNNSYEFKA
jgi:chromosome segregation ATPase